MTKNTVEVSGTSNTVSIGHIGDVTINEAPAPELQLGKPEAKSLPDGTQMIRIPAEVVAPYTPGSLRVEAWAPGLVKMDVIAQRTGMQMLGHCGTRENHAFATVMQPFGRYAIKLQMRELADIEIRYDFDV